MYPRKDQLICCGDLLKNCILKLSVVLKPINSNSNDITNVQVPAPPISVGDVANSVDMRVAWIPRKHE